MKHLFWGSLWVIASLSTSTALGYSETHDEYTLELKGYSQELIEPTQVQISRMEGRYPTPTPSKNKQLFYNMLNNDWVGNLEPFGQDAIDPPRHPLTPERKFLDRPRL